MFSPNSKARLPGVAGGEGVGEGAGQRDALLQALADSRSKQAALAGQIAANLTYLCESHIISSSANLTEGVGHSALLFSRQWAVRALEKHNARISVLAMRKAFSRWLSASVVASAELMASAFLRVLSARRLFKLAEFRMVKALCRALARYT